jgi:glycosyltransferase involved in cell wall biosynthesis
MKEKIKVLVLPSDRSGVSKFRSVDPHIALQSQFPDEFHVDIDYEPKINDPKYWSQYQIVHIHRNVGPNYEAGIQIIKNLNAMGIPTIIDIDDYWLPTKEHPIHAIIKENKIHEKIIENLKAGQYITTTTTIFADEIKKYNKNVFIFPNGINPEEAQFKEKTLPSDKIRVGWLGGSSHYHDLLLLEGMVSKLSDYQSKLKYVLCGFDTRGTMTEIDKSTGKQKQRPIKPHETVWVKYEEIFTDGYRIVSPEYKEYLNKFDSVRSYSNLSEEKYERVWTLPVTTYAKNYSKFDISLAPIKNHIFNKVKSQLKVIEAGFYKKALIASNVGPYTIDLKHSLVNGNFVDGNALLVDENKNHSDWSKFIKKLVDNPNMIEDMGNRLYETVKDTYDLRNITKDRAQWYKSIVK